MKISLCFIMTILTGVGVTYGAKPDVSEQEIDPGVIDLAPFVVYEGMIDVIDGFTAESYHGSHGVVEEFTESFNKLLLKFHRRLLVNEYTYMDDRLKLGNVFLQDMNALSESFEIKKVYFDLDELFPREKAITDRLVYDPFFIIDAVVVWDLDQLEDYKDQKLDSKYARDIRYNKELQKWERRITTRWEVAYFYPNSNVEFTTYKEQGLNLDTNRGYHLLEIGLPGNVPPSAFKDVKLTYPIFINSKESYADQVKRLRTTFVSNLFQIYDPYSWISRRDTRFRVGDKFKWLLRERVNSAKYRVTDPDWFNEVLTSFLTDVITMKHEGPDEIYDLEMLLKLRVRHNLLGVGFDPLNWNKGENRSVPYDATFVGEAKVDFNNASGARFVLVDAYRRYKDSLIIALRKKVLAQKSRKAEKVSGKELIESVLAEVSGIPADIYIRKASEAQLAELNKHKYELQ